MSKFSVQKEVENGLLKEITLPDLKIIRGISYVVRKDKVLSLPAKNFIHLLDKIHEQKNIFNAVNDWV